MSTIHQIDPELGAMTQVLSALEPLTDDARKRVLGWVGDRFGFKGDISARPSDTTQKPTVEPTASSDRPEGTINTVAFKLKVESCRDLLIAAAAYLTIYQGRERFTRADLVGVAREAQAWKSDFSAQTSINIQRMQKSNELFEKAKDVYALSPAKLKELEAQLAE